MEGARPAAPADLGTLTRLWAAAVAELAAERGGRALVATLEATREGRDPAEHLAGLLADDRCLVAVGVIDGTEVGLGVARAGGASPGVAAVELLYVEPAARQVGVGEAILDLIVSWCRARRCTGLDAPALPGSRAAKSFLEEQGFAARLLVMHRPLSEGAAGDARTE